MVLSSWLGNYIGETFATEVIFSYTIQTEEIWSAEAPRRHTCQNKQRQVNSFPMASGQSDSTWGFQISPGEAVYWVRLNMENGKEKSAEKQLKDLK